MRHLKLPLLMATLLVSGVIFLVIQTQRNISSSNRQPQKAGASASPQTIEMPGGVASGGIVYRQPVIAPPVSNAPVSPYEIAAFVNQYNSGDLLSLESYWQRMNTSVEYFQECYGCRAVIFKADLDEQSGKEIVLRLYSSMTPAAVYLVFKPVQRDSKLHWEFRGQTESVYQRFDPPTHRFITFRNQHWLVITHEVNHGSGVGTDSADWYEIINGRLRKVLHHLSSNFEMDFFNALEIRSNSGSAIIRRNHRVTTITIPITTTYRKYDSSHQKVIAVRRKRQKAVFVRNATAHQFQLDRQHSNLSGLSELQPVFVK